MSLEFLPRKLRRKLRNYYDAPFCKSIPDKETLGNGDTQWTILTRNLNPTTIIYSGGVGPDISFELELIRRFGVKIHIFDPSPLGKETIAKAFKTVDGLEGHLLFKPVGLAATTTGSFSIGGGNGDKPWFRTATEGDGANVPCTTIAAEMRANGHDHIDLLKLDIEGFEYEVLESCFAANIPIGQICVEFHHFFPDIPRSTTMRTINGLKGKGFSLIHRHRHDHTFVV